ncbi:MAG TPA: mercuric reductase [Myxococcota bacterium]|nr:mercuric reductase [Myxococcota bacterium]
MISAPPAPIDPSDEALLAAVHPSGWRNPEPADRYNLVVIGAGSGGLVTAAVAAGLGARVALVERDRMGGDCLNTGCVPSKAVIRAGRLAAEAHAAGLIALGPAPGARPDFATAMRRMRAVRADIAPHDSAERFRDQLGVDVFFGDARFVSSDAIEVDGRRLRFRRAVIATGARPGAPPVPGLAEAGFLTNETVFSLRERPARLAVIGGGPVGCELAQAFQRLGVDVTLVEMGAQLLEREDPDAAAIVARALVRDGVRVLLSHRLDKVETDAGGKTLHCASASGSEAIAVDEILVAAGRVPNVEGLGLEAAGVEFDPRLGVRIDDFLRTTNRRVLAVGDCALAWKFTHAADAAAKLAVQNALFLGRKRLSALVMPWCTYTDPELAHVGLHEHEARERGMATDTYEVPLEGNDRARCDGETEGFARIHTRKGSDRIVGATIVAAHAGEMISLVTTAITGGLGLGQLSGVIFPYPTQAEVLKAASGLYMRTRLTPRVKRLFERWMRLTR